MRYISTRGGPSAEFGDVLLGGPAADGGLYLPDTWPRISESEIAIVRETALCRSRVPRDAALRGGRIRRRGIPRRCGRCLRDLLAQGCRAAGRARSRSVSARAVPRPDLRLQGRRDAALGTAVRPRAQEAEAARDRDRRDVGRHGLGGHRRASRACRCRCRRAASAWAGLGGAAASDDDGARSERPQHRASKAASTTRRTS